MKLVGIPSRFIKVAAPIAIAVIPGCGSTPSWPSGDLEWSTYRHPTLGYVLEYPSVCKVREVHNGKDVMFRFKGRPIMVINYVTEREGRKRGLWPGKDSAGAVQVGGKSGKPYVYDHYDGPSHTHTVSYVVPYRGRFLGLEFRMAHDKPGAIQQRILDSFHFE